MANVRDSDTSLWLHNKLGTSNDSWISGSICSQLNKEVLRNIKECFPDLQTQVKLKLLLSLFHIPRRLVEEWKAELEEVIEVAGLDSELWVSMLAEAMKTFPASGSLNTEIADYDDNRHIFTDMVSDLSELVGKHSDLGMLPLECQYLNKNALTSVVGQHQNPVKHFTLKRKPKSAALRTELLHKSADAQSSLKKTSAPMIPLRSRGMPRKMTDTTPLKGIPSRMPTSGFRSSAIAAAQQRPNLSRTTAGRKDGGIKLIEFTEQPLGYAAAKKRKREQQIEEQQKKQELKQQNALAAAADSTSPTAQNATGTTAATPTTPTSANASFEIKTENESMLNQSGSADESFTETKDIVAKTEPITPDYAPSVTTYTQPSTPAVLEKTIGKAKSIITMSSANATTPTKGSLSKTNATATTNNNNNSLNHSRKRIKQEIEIKSEEILVPAAIKVEKIEPQTTPTPPLQAASGGRAQQRVIVQQQPQQQHVLVRAAPQPPKANLSGGVTLSGRQNTPLKMEKLTRQGANAATTTTTTVLTQQQLRQAANPLANLPNNISVKITSTKTAKGQNQNQNQNQNQQQTPVRINSATPVIIASSQTTATRTKQGTTPTTAQALKSMPLSQLKNATNSGPVIISQTIIQPAKRNTTANALTQSPTLQQQQQLPQQQPQQQQTTQYILTTSQPQPTLTSFTQPRQQQQQQQPTLYQTQSNQTQSSTKILLKTSGAGGVSGSAPGLMMTSLRQTPTSMSGNPPPLIATSAAVQQPTMLNIGNVQLPNRPVTIQPASQAAQQQHLQAQLQQQHLPLPAQPSQPVQQHTLVSNTAATQQPKVSQVLLQPNANKNKTFFLANKGVILRNIGGDMYQQIPVSNVGSLQGLGAGATILTTAAGPPTILKTTTAGLQQQQAQTNKPMPTLISTNALAPQQMIVQQPTTLMGNTTQQTIIRPVMPSGLASLPQGLTLIQRPGQQPQLVQVQTSPAQQQAPQLQRTIITQPVQQQQQQQQQLRPQQILLQQKPLQQRIITTAQASAAGGATSGQLQLQQGNRGTHIVQVTQQAQQQQQAPPQRKGLSLSNEHVHKAHEMFRKANRVSRPDKALILGFMAGLRENPRPSSENVIVIKLGDAEEKVQQDDGTTALCLVESLIRLDYNTGEWKTFQNYRRLDQNSSGQAGGDSSGGGGVSTVLQTQNQVVM